MPRLILRRDCPGRVVLWINPVGAITHTLGTAFPRPGMGGYWGAKFSCMFFSLLHISLKTNMLLVYKRFGITSFASVGISDARPFFWLADSDAIKRVFSDRHTFRKNLVEYEIIDVYGKNLASTEGANWKRHRSVAMSAFNEASCSLFLLICLILVHQGQHYAGLVRNSPCDRRMA